MKGGYAFVQSAEPNDSADALKYMDRTVLLGRTIGVRVAGEPRGPGTTPRESNYRPEPFNRAGGTLPCCCCKAAAAAVLLHCAQRLCSDSVLTLSSLLCFVPYFHW